MEIANRRTRRTGGLLIVLYVLVVLGPAVWAMAARPQAKPWLVELGRSTGMVAFAIFAMQLVLAARLHWIERPFGLDRLYRFHAMMAGVGGAIALLHPLALAAGYPSGVLLWGPEPWYINLGRIALAAGVLQILLSTVWLMKMAFHDFLWSHNVLGMLIFTFAFVHSLKAGRKLIVGPVLVAWWLLFLAALAAYLYSKTWSWTMGRRNRWRVDAVEKETHNVWTLALTPTAAALDYRPGQFILLKLLRGPYALGEEHPWTVSSSPTQSGAITVTIKESGDYTATIGRTQVGEVGLVRGPFGRFCYLDRPAVDRLVFIAGGVGITPLMSMLRHMRDTNYAGEVLLIDSNRTEVDILFADELERMSVEGRPRLTVVHTLTRPASGWTGPAGRIDEAMLGRLIDTKAAQQDFYVCGPGSMITDVRRHLKNLGVDGDRIVSEQFFF